MEQITALINTPFGTTVTALTLVGLTIWLVVFLYGHSLGHDTEE